MTTERYRNSSVLAREGVHHSLYSNPLYDRGAADYGYMFGISMAEFFAGQLVLDLGSGSKGGLAASLAETDVRVVSLSPNTAGSHLKTVYRPDTKYLPVSGLAQQLPFRSASFDGVVASWSVPMYLPRTHDHFAATFGEAQRVLRPEGIALFGPVDDGDVLQFTRRAIQRTVGMDHAHIGRSSYDRVVAIVKTPDTFDRPEVREMLAHIDNHDWRLGTDHPLGVSHLYGLATDAAAPATPAEQ
jgi:SAM-dependent methyltransferase